MDVDRRQLIDAADLEQITDEVRVAVAVGRRDFEQIVRGVIETWNDEIEDPEVLEETVREVAVQEFARHLAAQADWPPITDCDRLSLTMADLAMAGILPREHYTCCLSCGLGEMGRELKGLSWARGYVFYHEQDAELAVDGGGVYLAFGPNDLEGVEGVEGVRGGWGGRDGERDEGIGIEIVGVLRRRGLDVEWMGDTRQRIRVRVNWQRRRFGWLAEYPKDEHPEAGGLGEVEVGGVGEVRDIGDVSGVGDIRELEAGEAS
ncbi:DUF6891 domain-containing protein [Nonomuraea insulae]|uniref:DUF6891 domain-containing protein n=1 Tax=Nonomuraea insulae TaxID=1616787 RepID=A0ABW1DAK6_9ACTN